jgi:peptidoglycan hydrolase CwlO-like protein
MLRKTYLFMATLLSALLFTAGALMATERVARLSRYSPNTPDDNHGTVINSQIVQGASSSSAISDQQIQGVTFTVYTTQEIDDQNVALKGQITQNQINPLSAKIDQLSSNLKDLSMQNDALTKRVEELEKRLDQTK